MVIVFLIIFGITFFGMISLLFNSFSASNWDIVGDIKHDTKGFVKVMALLIGSAVGIYFCIVTPTSFIRNEYVHSNGTMTSVEYSISGDSTIKTNIKTPVTTCGRVTFVYHGSRMMAKAHWVYYTRFTAILNDGREIRDEITQNTDIKVGSGMTMTEIYYPYSEIKYNFK